MYLGLALNPNDRKKWKNFLMYCQKIVIIRKDFRPIPKSSNTVPLHLLFEVYNFDYYDIGFDWVESPLTEAYMSLDKIFKDDTYSSAFMFAKIILLCHIKQNSRITKKTPIISTLPKEIFMNPWFWVKYTNTLKKEMPDVVTPLNILKNTLDPLRFMNDDLYKLINNNSEAINTYHRTRDNTAKLFNILECADINLTCEYLSFNDPYLIQLRENVLDQEYSPQRLFEIILLNNLHAANVEIPQSLANIINDYEQNIEFWDNFLWVLARN